MDVLLQERLLMRPTGKLFTGMLQLGRYHYTAARRALPEHRHRNALEICYLVKGRQTYRVGETSYRLRGGDVFITFPGERHSTGGTPEEKGILYWLILSAVPVKAGLLGLPEREGTQLMKQLLGLHKRHFRGSSNNMKVLLDRFTRLYYQPNHPLKRCQLSHHLLGFLLEVLSSANGKQSIAQLKDLAPALTHIHRHLDEPISIPELAGLCGLSTARFKVRFREENGVPPGEYIQRARIQAAMQLLSESQLSITQIAFELGFSSSQYFASVFKRFTGSTPREAEKRLRGIGSQSSV